MKRIVSYIAVIGCDAAKLQNAVSAISELVTASGAGEFSYLGDKGGSDAEVYAHVGKVRDAIQAKPRKRQVQTLLNFGTTSEPF